jgi:hypothetical protein
MKVSNTIVARMAKVFSTLTPRPRVPTLRGCLIPLLLLLAASGCASIPFFGKSAKFDQADAKNPAVEILTLWQCTEGPGPQGVPIRGFAGQIYFFTQNKGAPVLVDGKVRIYLFDDHGTAKEQGRPIGEYDFNSANWNARAHRSSLGPGYSVFIPYPRNDFHQATCSLRIRFVPAVGPTIYSAPSAVVLNGPPTKPVPGDVPIVSPPAAPPAAASVDRTPLSVTLGPSYPQSSWPQASSPRVIVPVAGTEADTRFSLGNDVSADDDGSSRVTPIPDEAASTPRRIKLQSASSEDADEQ